MPTHTLRSGDVLECSVIKNGMCPKCAHWPTEYRVCCHIRKCPTCDFEIEHCNPMSRHNYIEIEGRIWKMALCTNCGNTKFTIRDSPHESDMNELCSLYLCELGEKAK